MRLTKKQAEAMGIVEPGKSPKRQRGQQVIRQNTAAMFSLLCRSYGLPEPVPEYPFAEHIGRGWRFDYAWVGSRIAVEIVGGVWIRGHHSRGQSQLDDMQRRNEAQIMGWVVLEFSPQQLDSGEMFTVLKRALGTEAAHGRRGAAVGDPFPPGDNARHAQDGDRAK